MIPVKLTIQGLYSYQEKQTIDFTKLTSASLFGIFGSVGSGKSSILEAITFAIYGKTDRLNLSGDNRNYNMMNLKSSELLIEFEFETGKNQTAYQAVVKGKRNGKKFEEVKALDRSAYRMENGNWIPIETAALESAIGLSYDNFKRTIIIPQGQFQEFLQLGNKDRTQMMKELFNLGKFEMFYKVVSLENKNNAEKQTLEGQLKQVGDINPEQVELYTAQLTGLKAELVRLKIRNEADQLKETELKQLQELVRKHDDNNLKLVSLNGKLPEIEKLEKQIADYEFCLIHFKNLFETLDSVMKKILQLEEKLRIDSQNLKKADDQIEIKEKDFAKIKLEYDQREKYKQKTDELEKLVRLFDLRISAGVLVDRVKKGEEVILETAHKIDQQRKEKEKLENNLREEKAKQPDMLTLSNAKSWHELNKNLQQQLVSNVAEEQKVKLEIQTADQSIKQIFDAALFIAYSGDKNTNQGIDHLKHKITELKNQVSGFESRIQHFKVQLKLEEFAVGLKDGDSCPVCGSLHHPEIISLADVSEALAQAEGQKSAIEKVISHCEKEILGLLELQHSRYSTEKQLAGVLARQNELKEKIIAHQLIFKWDNFRKEEIVLQAFVLAESLRKLILDLEKQLESNTLKLEKDLENKEKFIRNIDQFKSHLIESKTEINTLTEQIKQIDQASYSDKTRDEILREKESLIQKYSEIEKEFDSLNTQLFGLRKNKDILSGSITANQLQLEQERNAKTELSVQIEKAITDSEFESANSVIQIINQDLNLATEKQKVNHFRHEISNTRNQLDVLTKEIGKRNYNSEIHLELRKRLAENNDLLARRNKEYGIIEKSLHDLQKAIETQKDLRKAFEKMELRAENIRTMKSLFKASGFVNYISSVYLQNLCNAANDRFFQLTRQKLSLEITEDNNFQVRDFMNGGKVRSVKTLSGGQTFQAALSLALALADNIQKITESNQNFFFLDEGFGSLDKNSLSVVFDALKSLRKENRIVGVISHVDEMQQEIDTHLRIVNSEESGSKILVSWD